MVCELYLNLKKVFLVPYDTNPLSGGLNKNVYNVHQKYV